MLSSRVRYALAALTLLARNPSQSRTAERITAVTGAPLATLSKVLQALARAGIIRSVRGPRGGVRLAQDTARITVLDVVRAVDPVSHRRMLRSEALGPCLYRRLELLRQIAMFVLGRTTIAELADQSLPNTEPAPLSVEELLARAIDEGDLAPAAPLASQHQERSADSDRRRTANAPSSHQLGSHRGS